jgi:hypothetical protein
LLVQPALGTVSGFLNDTGHFPKLTSIPCRSLKHL